MANQTTVERLTAAFPAVEISEFRGQVRAVVPREMISTALGLLKNELRFDMLIDLTCVDYLAYRGAPGRFGLVYLLLNTESGERLTVRTFLDDPNPAVPSAVPFWEAANWLEREVWDLFGIHFEGHPDLRRIVLPEQFTAHPLRKDYPMQGRGERHNFPVITRGEG
jgi:NADH-quinone oxidoreductase subunit C